MIENPPPVRLQRPQARPSAADVAAFSDAATGMVVDALGGSGALPAEIKPITGAGAQFAGVALPCHCGPNDNLALFAAVSLARPGDVIIATACGYRGAAVAGDQVLGMARNAGVIAFVTDGCVRDQKGIVAVGLPCFATGVTPNSPARSGPGTAGLPIILGGVGIAAGDLVIGDEDGVVIVPYARVSETIARLAAVREAEAALEAEVKGGLIVPEFLASLLGREGGGR